MLTCVPDTTSIIHHAKSFIEENKAAYYVLKILNDDEMPKEVVIDSEMVTIENAEWAKPVF